MSVRSQEDCANFTKCRCALFLPFFSHPFFFHLLENLFLDVLILQLLVRWCRRGRRLCCCFVSFLSSLTLFFTCKLRLSNIFFSNAFHRIVQQCCCRSSDPFTFLTMTFLVHATDTTVATRAFTEEIAMCTLLGHLHFLRLIFFSNAFHRIVQQCRMVIGKAFEDSARLCMGSLCPSLSCIDC